MEDDKCWGVFFYKLLKMSWKNFWKFVKSSESCKFGLFFLFLQWLKLCYTFHKQRHIVSFSFVCVCFVSLLPLSIFQYGQENPVVPNVTSFCFDCICIKGPQIVLHENGFLSDLQLKESIRVTFRFVFFLYLLKNALTYLLFRYQKCFHKC